MHNIASILALPCLNKNFIMPTDNQPSSETIDLRARAERAVREAGFETQFSAAALAEAENLDESVPFATEKTRDLSGLLWSSIDLSLIHI